MAAVLLDRIREQTASSDGGDPDTGPFGFSLDSSTERAEPYDASHGDEYDDEGRRQ